MNSSISFWLVTLKFCNGKRHFRFSFKVIYGTVDNRELQFFRNFIVRPKQQRGACPLVNGNSFALRNPIHSHEWTNVIPSDQQNNLLKTYNSLIQRFHWTQIMILINVCCSESCCWNRCFRINCFREQARGAADKTSRNRDYQPYRVLGTRLRNQVMNDAWFMESSVSIYYCVDRIVIQNTNRNW